EDFLMHFENTVIVVSHDRHFLNKVCTHIADVDFGKIEIYIGNYDFWYESSKLATKMAKKANKKKEEKIKDIQAYSTQYRPNKSIKTTIAKTRFDIKKAKLQQKWIKKKIRRKKKKLKTYKHLSPGLAQMLPSQNKQHLERNYLIVLH